MIREKAHQIWLDRGGTGGSAEDDWSRAKELLEKEFAASKHPLKHFASLLNQPLIKLEKSLVEPVADWVDRSDIFRIFERLSPLLEAVEVLLIPLLIWWLTQGFERNAQNFEHDAQRREEVRVRIESEQEEIEENPLSDGRLSPARISTL